MNQNHERAEDHPVVDSLVDSEVETPAAVALEAVIPTVDSVEVALITINVTAVLEEENQASAVVETTMPVASVEDNLVDSDKKIAVSVVETPAASEVVATLVASEVVATPVAALEEETPAAALEEETLVVASEVVTPVVASAEEVAVVVVTMAMACSLAASLTKVPKTLFAPILKVSSQMPQEFRYRQAKTTQVRSGEWLLLTLDHLQKRMLL